jgi:hypothetical protein
MTVISPNGMMIILQYAREAMHFARWQRPGEKAFAFFLRQWR